MAGRPKRNAERMKQGLPVPATNGKRRPKPKTEERKRLQRLIAAPAGFRSMQSPSC